MSERIVQAGMYRTGTTWQFNAVRVCFELDGAKVCARLYQPTMSETDADVDVLMTRRVYPDLAASADWIVSTWRDPEDTKASMRRRAAFLREHQDHRWKNESDVGRYDDFMRRASWWMDRAHYVQDFDRIRADPLGLIEDYISLFDLGVKPMDVMRTMEREMVVPSEGTDLHTLLHVGHITLP